MVPWNFTGQAGWAQVNGRDDIPIPKKVEYDEYYLNHRSFHRLLPFRPAKR
jgi:lipopolysaccharide/colanic/teichoic acid biosynthesis glycosyltransferase